jgi:hypothetical protein
MEKHRFVASRGLEQLVQEAGDRELAPELLPMVVPCARDALMVQDTQIVRYPRISLPASASPLSPRDLTR